MAARRPSAPARPRGGTTRIGVSRDGKGAKAGAAKSPGRRRARSATDAIHPALRKLPLLEFMSGDVRRLVADSFRPVTYPFGAIVVREGEAADAFYVVASGHARAVKRADDGEEVPLGAMGPGDSFGELALVEHTTRAASVRASSELVVLRLDRAIFEALVEQDSRLRAALDLHVKRLHLQDFLRLYTAFAALPPAALQVFLREAQDITVEAGERVVREGERSGPMYVVRDGRLRAYRNDGKRKHLAFLRRGEFFGEVSMFRSAPREATIEALTRCSLLRINRRTFDRLMQKYPEFRASIEERVSQYEYQKVARVPLDFADEILPADLGCSVSQPNQPLEPSARSVEIDTPEDLLEEAAPRAERIRRMPFVWQIDEADCGAACLAMVTRQFGRDVALGHLRRVSQAGIDGTSLMGIAQGAEAVGLDATPVKVSKSRLDAMPLPAIVHWEGNHWIVLYDVDGKRVRVADPGRGLRRVRRDEFIAKWSGYAVFFQPTPALADAPVGTSGVRWVWGFLRPYVPTFVRAALLALLAAGISMLFPIFTQLIVDRVLIGRSRPGFVNVILLAMLGSLAVMLLAQIGQRFLLARAAVAIDGTALDTITGRLLALPMQYFHTRRTGDLLRRLGGLRQTREFFVSQGVIGITAVTQLVAAIVLMFVYSPLLALVFLAVAPAYAGLMRFSATRLRPVFDSLEESFGKYQSRQVDAIRGIETIKALGADDLVRRRITAEFGALARRVFRADFMMMMYGAAIQLVTFLSLALFLWIGARQVLADRLSIGELVSFNALVLLANAPLVQLLSLWDELQLSSVLLHRLNDVFEQAPEQGDDHSALLRVPTLEGRIRCTDVTFHYPGGADPVLEHVSFEIPPGGTTAIVGRSGSGKTTLAKCLAGLIEPSEGTITFDGIDLRTLDYRDLRRQIGFVLQENYLFDDTIARNIALGEETPDMDRVVRAATAADVSTFIDRLPLGFETKVGESGVLLSGGQRQRIAIARALYSRPPVLILDEATSSLDVDAERAVQDNLAGLTDGRTTIVIAHRLSTVRDADQILVIERGRIVERGRHEELMARRGIYYYLCSQQLGL